MQKDNIIVAALLALSIIGYIILSVYDKDLQVIQSIVSLFAGIMAGQNRQSLGKAVMSGAKKLGFIK